jgi:methionyl aminopeptidase
MHWPDNWTAATEDGKRSAQFEHTLLITEDGVEVLTARLPTSPNNSVWFKSPEVQAQFESSESSASGGAESASA